MDSQQRLEIAKLPNIAGYNYLVEIMADQEKFFITQLCAARQPADMVRWTLMLQVYRMLFETLKHAPESIADQITYAAQELANQQGELFEEFVDPLFSRGRLDIGE